LQVAQVEIARHPAIALDLLVFQVATATLGKGTKVDAAEVQFKSPRLFGKCEPDTAAGDALKLLAESLPVEWLKPKSEAARFEAFRLLPDTAKHELLAYCIAMTLKPKLAPAAGEEATAHDIALSLTGADVAGYWRPTRANFLARVNRDQLLTISHNVFGEAWSQAHGSDKKSLLVDQLDRAFSDPDKSGRTPEQVQRLNGWLPVGMAFDLPAAVKPSKAKKARKAA
jgi:ParB family chromosome partitioning protein